MKCSRCNGTGHMTDEDAGDCFEATGERPNQYWGCVECDGSGEVEEDGE